MGFLKVSGYSFGISLSVNQLKICNTWMIQCKKPLIVVKQLGSVVMVRVMVSRKLKLQASEQNVNSAWQARPAAKRRSVMRKQPHLIVV